MHQRRSLRPVYSRVVAAGIASLPVLGLVAIRAAGYCYPGCVIWDSSDPQWHFFLCYLCGA